MKRREDIVSAVMEAFKEYPANRMEKCTLSLFNSYYGCLTVLGDNTYPNHMRENCSLMTEDGEMYLPMQLVHKALGEMRRLERALDEENTVHRLEDGHSEEEEDDLPQDEVPDHEEEAHAPPLT